MGQPRVVRNYGEYEESEENIHKFGSNIIGYFTKFRRDFIKRHQDHIPTALLRETKKFTIDSVRLQKVVVSIFKDVKRYADFHNLFDCNGKIDICEHKEAGYFIKWFMSFTPILIPDAVVSQYRTHSIEFDNNNARDAYDEVEKINEYFALHTALHVFVKIPEQQGCFMHMEERRDILYMLTYRVGRLDGVDLAMLLHWIQQTLAQRPSYTYALLQALNHIPSLPESLLSQKRELEQQMEMVYSTMPEKDGHR